VVTDEKETPGYHRLIGLSHAGLLNRMGCCPPHRSTWCLVRVVRRVAGVLLLKLCCKALKLPQMGLFSILK